MRVDESVFTTGDYCARLLRRTDLALIRVFNEQCSDFFMMQNGAQPAEKDAVEIFEAVPSGRRVEDKLPIGVFEFDGRLLGLIDALGNYRMEFDWWIGLMLLAPASRNAGLGSKIHGAFENYAVTCGAKRLGLAVLEENCGAHRFWSKLGYRKIRDHPPTRYGCRIHACTEYEKLLLV